jgi:ribosomal protein S18 acetylase RimI-like enzyme
MRQAKPSDALAVTALLRQVAETGVSFAAPHEIDPERIARDLAEGLGLRIVVERNGEVVGYLKLDPGLYESVARTARMQLAVREDLRGRGIGAELLRAAVSWAEGGALDRIEIFVRENNPRAIALYKRFGFVEEGRLRQRVRLRDGRRVDDVVLGRLCSRPIDTAD